MLIQDYVSTPPTKNYACKKFDERVLFNKKSFKYADQSDEWQKKMYGLGLRLKNAKVGLIYFVHGTFTGDDTFGLIKLFEQKYPFIAKLCKVVNKAIIDTLMGDCGNYTSCYVTLFKKAIDTKIYCDRFIWNSENNHFGRLKGSIKLIERISNDINEKKLSEGERVLLIGHSHAGQLFALMTNFLARSPEVKSLLTIARDGNIDTSRYGKYLEKISTVHLDYVTCGTPLRYKWGDREYKLLNIINHRGDGFLAGGNVCVKFPFTKDGDYVQQLGIAGSDICLINRLNKQLKKILGEGMNICELLKNVKARMRVPSYGKTILVDYKDNSTYLPNCRETLFGHGVYTRFEKMLFNTKLIVDEMY